MRLSSRFARAALFTTAALLVPAVSKADPTWTRSWSLCITGTLVSCHSVQLQTTGFGTYTAVKVTVRNLNGQDPLLVDNTLWSGLSLLRFYGSALAVNPSDNTQQLSSLSLQGGATNPGGAAGWAAWINGGGLTPGVLRLSGTTAQLDNTNRRVGGCNTSGTGSQSPVMFTCGGEVVFSFNTATLFNASQIAGVFAQADARDLANTATYTQSCQTDGTTYTGSVSTLCTHVTDVTTVTPEPITIALLGSGLFGVAGARLRRRKKTEE